MNTTSLLNIKLYDSFVHTIENSKCSFNINYFENYIARTKNIFKLTMELYFVMEVFYNINDHFSLFKSIMVCKNNNNERFDIELSFSNNNFICLNIYQGNSVKNRPIYFIQFKYNEYSDIFNNMSFDELLYFSTTYNTFILEYNLPLSFDIMKKYINMYIKSHILNYNIHYLDLILFNDKINSLDTNANTLLDITDNMISTHNNYIKG